MKGLTTMAIAALALTVLAGCPGDRLNNQGGTSLVKVAGIWLSNPSDPPIGDLNPDDWQFIGDNAPQFAQMVGIELPAGVTWPALTDEQAADIVKFLDDNCVTNATELQALASQVASGEVQVPQSLIDLVGGLGIDVAGLEG